MSKHGLVSVILPTYNRAQYIGDCISSVLSQSYQDFELLVVDDGSTDDTMDVVSGIEDSRIRYFYQENSGRSAARNLALLNSFGDYIAFIDSDDLYLEEKLRLQVEYLNDKSEYQAVYASGQCIDANSDPLDFTYVASDSGDIYEKIAYFIPTTILLPSVMIRRAVFDRVGLFDESLDRFEDTDYWRRIARDFNFGAMDQILVKVRTHYQNALVSQSSDEVFENISRYIEKVRTEDSDLSPLLHMGGASRLFRYYSRAYETLDGHANAAKCLMNHAVRSFQPLVSIVIPVYNGSDYLDQAISSALAQSYKNIEVIVVNDGSTDGGLTDSVASRYIPRIRYVCKDNGGVGSALNFGVSIASGEYISWLSHDDVYEPNKISDQIKLLSSVNSPANTICTSDYTVFGSTIRKPYRVSVDMHRYSSTRLYLLLENSLHGCTLLIPRRALTKEYTFNSEKKTTQDYDLWFRLAACMNFVHCPKSLVLARSHSRQGSIEMQDLALSEINTLYSGWLDLMQESELKLPCIEGIHNSLYFISLNLASRGFLDCSKHAMSLALQAESRLNKTVVEQVFETVRYTKALEAKLKAIENSRMYRLQILITRVFSKGQRCVKRYLERIDDVR